MLIEIGFFICSHEKKTADKKMLLSFGLQKGYE